MYDASHDTDAYLIDLIALVASLTSLQKSGPR